VWQEWLAAERRVLDAYFAGRAEEP
jgi:hypothetical protein